MNDLLNKYGIDPIKIKIINNAKIIYTIDNKYVLRKNNKKIKDIYKYLESRNFTYYPVVYSDKESIYELTKYIEEIDLPIEQKLSDMIYLVSILHTKTTFYKEISIDDIKKIYEKYIDYLNNLKNYYYDINTYIENEVYMSPSNYLLIRNITSVYSILNIGINYINKWYNIVKDKSTIRYSLNHNNLKLHNLKEDNENIYLVNWDFSNYNYPVNDLINIYINNYKIMDIKTMLNIYQSKYKLEEYEIYYFIAGLCKIERIDLKKKEIEKIKDVYEYIEYINNVIEFVLEYDSKKHNEEEYSYNK